MCSLFSSLILHKSSPGKKDDKKGKPLGMKEKLTSAKIKKRHKKVPVLTSSDLQLILQALQKETERLRSIYPLYDLLEAKRLEGEKARSLITQPLVSPPSLTGDESQARAEALLQAHEFEENEIRLIIQRAEERFQLQFERIEAMQLYLAGKSTEEEFSKAIQISEF